MCFGPSVFGLKSPTSPVECSLVKEILRDAHDKETGRRDYPVPEHAMVGSGFPLKSYHPQHRPRLELFVHNTFTFVSSKSESAVVDMMECAQDVTAFPSGVNKDIGSSSWDWEEDVRCKQKLSDFKLFDPEQQFFKRGAHVPLMIFLGSHSQQRRSREANQRRNKKADERGWNYYRRHQNKGKGKGK